MYHLRPQAANKVKNSTGVDITRKLICIIRFETSEDRGLKIKDDGELANPEAYFDTIRAMAAVIAEEREVILVCSLVAEYV